MAVGVAVVRVSDLAVVDSNPAWRSLFSSTDDPQVLYTPVDSDPETAARPIRRGISRDGHWVGTVGPAATTARSGAASASAPARDEVHRAVWVLTATDVSAEQDAVAEARSAVARQRSEAAALLRVHVFKDEFLTIVSHDLRTPLTAVRGFVDLLRTGRVRSDPAGLKSMLDRMATSLQDMTLLVDRLLYWGMLQSGTASIAPRPLRLADEVGAVVTQLGDLLRDRDVRTDVPGDLVALVDPLALERMLVQLLANAVKYSAPGSRITVTAQSVEPEADTWHPVPEVVVTVVRRGPRHAAGPAGRAPRAHRRRGRPGSGRHDLGAGPGDRAALRRPARRPGPPRQPAAPRHHRVLHAARSAPTGLTRPAPAVCNAGLWTPTTAYDAWEASTSLGRKRTEAGARQDLGVRRSSAPTRRRTAPPGSPRRGRTGGVERGQPGRRARAPLEVAGRGQRVRVDGGGVVVVQRRGW